MKITVLDMDTAAIDGDVSLSGLAALGELRVFGETGRENSADLIGDSEAVICNKTRITREVMEKCRSLKYVGLMGTGFDQVDIPAANEFGITVCNVPSYSSDAVAQHTFGLILNYFCRISEYTADCAGGGWAQKKYFSSRSRISPGYPKTPMTMALTHDRPSETLIALPTQLSSSSAM